MVISHSQSLLNYFSHSEVLIMSACHTQKEDKTACVIITHVLTSKTEAISEEARRAFKLGLSTKREEQSHQTDNAEY